jgi:hypothetical protein
MDVKFTKLAPKGVKTDAEEGKPPRSVSAGQLQALADRHGVEVVEIDRQWAFHEGTALAIDKTGLGHDIVEFHLDKNACPEVRDKFLKYDAKKMDLCFAQNIMNQIRGIELKNVTGFHGKPASVYDPSVKSSFYQWMMYCGPYAAVTLEHGSQGFKAGAPDRCSLALKCEVCRTPSKCKARCTCKNTHCRCSGCSQLRHRTRQQALFARFSKEAGKTDELSPELLKQILERVIQKMDAEIEPSPLCCGASMVLAKTASKACTAQPYGVTVPLSAEEEELLGEVAKGSKGVFTSLDDITDAMRKSKFRLFGTDFVKHHPGHKVLINHPLVKIPLQKTDDWEASELKAREQFGLRMGAKIWNLSTHSFYLCFPDTSHSTVKPIKCGVAI